MPEIVNLQHLHIPMSEMGAQIALFNFISTIDNVFSKRVIMEGQAFIEDLNQQKPEAISTVFDYVMEKEKLLKYMGFCKTFSRMKNAFNKSSPGCQKLVIKRLCVFLDLLQKLPKNQKLMFPDEPIDTMRYFFTGEWYRDKRLITIPKQ